MAGEERKGKQKASEQVSIGKSETARRIQTNFVYHELFCFRNGAAFPYLSISCLYNSRIMKMMLFHVGKLAERQRIRTLVRSSDDGE